MKILEEGKLPADEYRGRCNRCGCLASVGREELKSGYPGTNREDVEYVSCPTEGCGEEIDVSKYKGEMGRG